MKNTYNWKDYNKTRTQLSKRILKYNNTNTFNFIEKGLYNHVRDIFCLGMMLLYKDKKVKKILDYGSNLLSLSNIKNKIDTKKYYFFIFEPSSEKQIKIKKPHNITIFNNVDTLKKMEFDLINFGSCLQYLASIKQLERILDFSKTKVIVITHTPLTLKKKFESEQKNHKNLTQCIHNYYSLVNFFKRKKFKLIFKSINENKYTGLIKQNKNTFSLNLIFQK